MATLAWRKAGEKQWVLGTSQSGTIRTCHGRIAGAGEVNRFCFCSWKKGVALCRAGEDSGEERGSGFDMLVLVQNDLVRFQ